MSPSTGRKPILILTGASGLFGTTFIRRHGEKFEIVGIVNQTDFPNESSDTVYFDPVNQLHSRYPVRTIRCDLGNFDSMRSVIDSICNLIGKPNALINAAADMRFLGSTLEFCHFANEAEMQYRVNVIAPLFIASCTFENAWKSIKPVDQDASILNISSVSASKLFPGSRQATYAASKAALNSTTLYMASEYKSYNIRVNGLVPNRFQAGEGANRVVDAAYRLLAGFKSGLIVPVE